MNPPPPEEEDLDEIDEIDDGLFGSEALAEGFHSLAIGACAEEPFEHRAGV
jgi:hypothetical protein